MKETLGPDEIVAMLRGAAAKIRDGHAILTELDSATGDGDHGAAMLRAMDALEQAVNQNAEAGLKEQLKKAGWAIMSTAGGSTGPLLGSFFTGMSHDLDEPAKFDAPALSALIRNGVSAMHKHSKAQAGDRTMMDALLPAAETLAQHETAKPPAELLQLAASAARTGADRTREMRAKFGRARNLGDRVLGHADPGATSMALILEGFAEGLQCPDPGKT